MSQIAGIQDFRQEGPPGDIGVFQGAASIIVYSFTFSGTTYYVAQRMGVRGWSLVSQGPNAGIVIKDSMLAASGGNIFIKGSCKMHCAQQKGVSVAAGASLTVLNVSGFPGVIKGLWFSGGTNPDLKITVDGITTIDTFSVKGTRRAYYFLNKGYSSDYFQTDYFGSVDSNAGWRFIDMPFTESCEILITNREGSAQIMWSQAIYQRLDEFKPNVGTTEVSAEYLYGFFDAYQEVLGKITLANINGLGRYVGICAFYDPNANNDFSYLEGRIYITIDGNADYISSGTEDYYLGSSYFAGGKLTSNIAGNTYKDVTTSRITAYRYHLFDSILFTSSFKMEQENSGGPLPWVNYLILYYKPI